MGGASPWQRCFCRLESQSRHEQAAQYTELANRIKQWRKLVAAELTMAPGAVLANHLMKSIAHTRPTKVETLKQIGCRVGDLGGLIRIIADAGKEFGWSPPEQENAGKASAPLQLVAGLWGPKVAPMTINAKAKKPPAWTLSPPR